MENKTYFVYLAKCCDNTLYCGYTTDIKKREACHNSGLGAKYTKSRLPVKIIYFETFLSKSEALKREAAIKKLKRCEKLELIKKFLSDYTKSAKE